MKRAKPIDVSVSSQAQLGVLAKYAFLNYFRARRFYIMLGVILTFGGALTFAAAYTRSPFFGFGQSQDAYLTFFSTFWGSWVSLLTLFSVVFFAGDAISGEFQNKTGYYLVPNPVRRSVVYLGKALAALSAATIMLGLFAAIALLNGLYFFGTNVPIEWVEALAFAWVSLAATLVLTLMFSSLFKNSSISITVTVLVLFFVFSIINTISISVAGIEPWFSLTYGTGIITDVLMKPYPAGEVQIRGVANFTITAFAPSIVEGLSIIAAYFGIASMLGLFLFERNEFT